MSLAIVTSIPVNEFNGARLRLLTSKIEEIVSESMMDFSMTIWDYSYSVNGLLRFIEVCSRKDRRNGLMKINQAFPSLSGKAKRLFEQSMREERDKIEVVSLANGCVFAIVATPENLMVLAVKSASDTHMRRLLEKSVSAVADIRVNFPSTLIKTKKQSRTTVMTPAIYGQPLAAL